MSRSRRNELGVGLLLLSALALLAWMSLKVGAIQGLGDTILIEAELEDAAGLSEGAEVKVAGVGVGVVETLVVEHDKALITLRIQQDAEIREDAVIQVRARSLLGEKYVEIRPQSADAALLENGDALTKVEGQTEIDQLINQLGPLVETVNPQALTDTMALIQGSLEDDPERLSRMLDDVETILDNSARASEKLPTISSETELLVADLRVLSGDAQVTLAKVRDASSRIGPLMTRADALIGELEKVAEPLPETSAQVELLVGELREAVAEGRTVIETLDSSSELLVTVLNNLSELDKVELRRLLREEGILVRLRESEVRVEASAP
jgi:phospholipid/cholesterol/gamma-HCH transport system substrate-binding protein